MVKLVGHNLLCTATVIGRQQLLTANHCVEKGGPFFVVAGRARIAVASHVPSGQTTLLTLASPLPGQFVPIATGDAGSERLLHHRGLRHGAARPSGCTPPASRRRGSSPTARYGGLVDPQRRGPISASACMGDSGGPVAKFDGKRYVLVGIVERVSNYAGIGACGFLTHFSAVSGSSNYASAPAGSQSGLRAAPPGARLRQEAAPLGVSALDQFTKGHGEAARRIPRRFCFGVRATVVRMKRSEIRLIIAVPHCASLHAGYEAVDAPA